MRKALFFIIFICTRLLIYGQQPLQMQLEQRGEVIVSFDAGYLKNIPNVGSWSVDKVINNKAYVYLNTKQYNKLLDLNIPFIPEPVPSLMANVQMAHTIVDMSAWDAYPDYDTYVGMMQQFATDYPDICRLDTIGTTVQNRSLLALKISDNVDKNESEPGFFYSSSMHGDELTGYVLMLRLADYLLKNYNNPQVKNLVDNLEIYINPLANPDGTFTSDNSTVSGASRYNASGVDLNRNFPDVITGKPAQGDSLMPETIAMIKFMQKHHFNMSVNFHGGNEVLNYPWDHKVQRHPDDAWFQFICRAYVDTVHSIDPNYMTDLKNGITNGYDWYTISGGRQDYVTHFLHGREITAELSTIKLVSPLMLPGFWDRNYKSLLHYMEQATYGIHGKITDSSGNPLEAKITVRDHDTDSSIVRTQGEGVFYRYLKAGTYTLDIEAPGYLTKTVAQVEVKDFEATPINIVLEPKPDTIDTISISEQKSGISLYPNPARESFVISSLLGYCLDNVQLFGLEGKLIKSRSGKGSPFMLMDVSDLSSGIYLICIQSKGINYSYKIVKK